MVTRCLLAVFLLVIGFVDQSHSDGSSAIHWLGYCSQEANRDEAKILSLADLPSETKGNYCVSLEGQPFEPVMGGYSDDPGKKQLPGSTATMLLIAVDIERMKLKNGILVVSVEQQVPVCQECDGGCWKFKNWETLSKSFPLSGKVKRYVFDVGNIIPSWNLMGIRVKSTVRDEKKVVEESNVEKEGWAWCF
jgi:hypothetical protein